MPKETLRQKAERLERENAELRARNAALERSNAMLQRMLKTREDLLTDLAELGERRREEMGELKAALSESRASG